MIKNQITELLHWMCRDFKTTEYWKSEARRFYLATIEHPFGDADSDLARKNFAQHIDFIFSQFIPQEVETSRWIENFSSVQKIIIPPPEIKESLELDWIADYFLLAAGVSWEEFEAINVQRAAWNQKLEMRSNSNQLRAKKRNQFIHYVFDPIIEQYDVDIDNIIIETRKKHFPLLDEKTGLSRDEKKRSSLDKNILSLKVLPLKDNEPDAKITLPMITLYQHKYFQKP
jgi:hypothetical protein